MIKVLFNRKGIILFIVLATVFIVILLANIMLSILNNQTRLTQHQISRIQAYYGAMAGINLAYEKLRTGSWPAPFTDPNKFYTRYLCNSATAGVCSSAYATIDPAFPSSINNITINVVDATAPSPPIPCNPPAGISICVNSTADYQYTP